MDAFPAGRLSIFVEREEQGIEAFGLGRELAAATADAEADPGLDWTELPFEDPTEDLFARKAIENNILPAPGGRDKEVFAVGCRLLIDRGADGGVWLYYMRQYVRRLGLEKKYKTFALLQKLTKARKNVATHWLLYSARRSDKDAAWRNPRIRPLIAFLDLRLPVKTTFSTEELAPFVAECLARPDFGPMNLHPEVVEAACRRVVRERQWRRGSVLKLVKATSPWMDKVPGLVEGKDVIKAEEIFRTLDEPDDLGNRTRLGHLMESLGFGPRRLRSGTVYERGRSKKRPSLPTTDIIDIKGASAPRVAQAFRQAARRMAKEQAEVARLRSMGWQQRRTVISMQPLVRHIRDQLMQAGMAKSQAEALLFAGDLTSRGRAMAEEWAAQAVLDFIHEWETRQAGKTVTEVLGEAYWKRTRSGQFPASSLF